MNSSISFEESIKLSNEVLSQSEANGYENLDSVKELLTSTPGARGFFVALLTGDWSFRNEIPSPLIEICTSAGAVADELLTKNLVMSSCTRVHHLRTGNAENATGSERVIQRTSFIIENQKNPSETLTEELSLVKEALDRAQNDSPDSDSKYGAFLLKWKYDKEQMAEAGKNVAHVLSKIK